MTALDVIGSIGLGCIGGVLSRWVTAPLQQVRELRRDGEALQFASQAIARASVRVGELEARIFELEAENAELRKGMS